MDQDNILLDAASNELEIIEFYIDEIGESGEPYRGYYGMNVAKVLEIIRRPAVTGVPSNHHSAVLGTFNLRGRVLPLVDLAMWLGKTRVESDSLKVIVSEFSGVVTAFLVSGVNHIHRLTWSRIEAPEQYLQSFSNHSITGVVRIDERILFILDMEQMIAAMTPGQEPEEIEKQNELPDDYGQGCRVLVVDDSMAIRKLISNILAKAGFEVMNASTGLEAFDILQKIKRDAEGGAISDYVDLVISDIEMPQMDGHTLLKKVREDPILSKLPMVLFSSHITEALRKKGMELKADDQISKPDLPTLTKRVRALIAERWGK